MRLWNKWCITLTVEKVAQKSELHLQLKTLSKWTITHWAQSGHSDCKEQIRGWFLRRVIRSSSTCHRVTLWPLTLFFFRKTTKTTKALLFLKAKIFLLSLKCPSFYSFSEEEKEEECEQLSLSESVTRSSSGNTSSELASVRKWP
jgi:hypothetical protein